MTDDLPFGEPLTPPMSVAPRRTCRHPKDGRVISVTTPTVVWTCTRCGKDIDPERAARGRRANQRGRRIQKQAMNGAGLDNLPGNLPGLDGARGMFKGESKSGGAFPERLWRWLKAVPVAPGQVPILVVSDTPGPGRKRRQVVVLELADWRALHGEDAA